MRSALVAGVVASAAGGAIGARLLWSANDADPAALAALHAHADPEPPPRRPRRRVVIAVLDGAGENVVAPLVAAGALGRPDWQALVDTGTPSLSRPGYHVLLTGVPQDVSGIRTNEHAGSARADTLADRVRAGGGRVAWALEGVPWFHDLAGLPADAYERGARATSRASFERLWATGPDLVIVHLVSPDATAHHEGASGPAYRAAVERALACVVELRERTLEGPEESRPVWFVGADHGHVSRGGHGGPEPDVTHVAWYGLWPAPAAEPVSVPGRVPATALAATFAAAAGLPAPREAFAGPLPLPGLPAAPLTSAPPRAAAVARAQQGAGLARAAGAGAGALALGVSGALLGVGPAARALAPAAVALLAYAAVGPGATVSAIREVWPFLRWATAALAAGAAAGWMLVRGRTDLGRVAWASLSLPLLAIVALRGSLGHTDDPHLFFAALLTGLVPASTALGACGAEAARRLAAGARTLRWPSALK